jgi:hypothetical protein
MKSLINPEIEYEEKTDIHSKDYGTNVVVYKGEYNGHQYEIAFGKIQNKFKEKGVLYLPVYIVSNNKITLKIGILEFPVNIKNEIMDENNEINITKTPDILLFNHFSLNELENYYSNDETNTLIETLELAQAITERYKQSPEKSWIQNYFLNDNYTIIETKSDGDCYFDTLRLAFENTETKYTVNQLRIILQEEFKQSIYKTYEETFNMLRANMKNETTELKDIKKQIKENKAEKIKNQELIIKANELNQSLNENKITYNNYQFMEKIKPLTFENFKNFILTKDFWADEWAILTLEEKLNFKTIILLENNDMNITYKNVNIVQCGGSNQNMDNLQKFTPKHYIITSYSGNHYRLIEYKDTKIFEFKQLPFHLVELVTKQCMEGIGGIYNKIANFTNFKNLLAP